MSKSNSLKFCLSDKDIRALRRKEPKQLRAALDKAIKPELNDLTQHFNKHGWDLDYNIIKGEVVNRLVGFDLGWAVIYRLVNAGYEIHSSPKTRGLIVRKAQARQRERKKKKK